MGEMIFRSNITELGNRESVRLGKKLVEDMKNDASLKESYNFKEDNTMSNSDEFYTTVLAKAIWYKSYNDFQMYFDMVWNLTPADLGMPEGAGAYKLPKVYGAVAAKLASGEVVEYTNDNKDSVTLETETYGIGTRINRRLLKRAAKGAIEKLMQSASDAVLRAVCTDIINGMVTAAASGNTVTGGMSYDAVETAKYNIKTSTTSEGVNFGFVGKAIAFSSLGWKLMATSDDFKAIMQLGQRNVPGDKVENYYTVFNGLKVYDTPLISVLKGGAAVYAIVVDTDSFFAFLMETQMETFEGRLPGTAGDMEIIHALDAGMVAMNTEAAAVITA